MHGETQKPLGVVWMGEPSGAIQELTRSGLVDWIESSEQFEGGCELADRLAPDVILIHRQPGGLTALEAIPALRRRFASTALLYLAERQSSRLGARAAWLGADEVDHAQIVERVELLEHALLSACRRHRLRQRLSSEYRRLQAEAVTDSLTGAYNRRFFDAQLRREIDRARRYSSPLSLLMLDIDHFKQINDTYGHRVGDRMLQEMVQIMRRTIRGSDLLARFGGEEFVLILPSTDPAGAAHLAERLLQCISRHAFPIQDGDRRKCITVSVGLAYFSGTQPEVRPSDLVSEADRALYQAKQDGRNRLGQIIGDAPQSRSVEAEGAQ